MPLHNREVARIFDEVADLLEIRGANAFRVRAYRRASRTLTDLSGSVAEMVEGEDDLGELPGIGDDLADKIAEIVGTGTLGQLEELRREVSPTLRDLLKVESLGPKRVSRLHQDLGVTTLDELGRAARAGEVRQVEGFGEKMEASILEQVERLQEQGQQRRFLWVEIEQYAGPLLEYLEQSSGVERLSAAGSFRRGKETVGDLDILAACDDAGPVMEALGVHEPYALDLERVLRAAAERGCTVELNASAQRLDLDDVHCKLAKELGLAVPISTDAHSVGALDQMRLGVQQARRGWLAPRDVLNTLPLDHLREALKRR